MTCSTKNGIEFKKCNESDYLTIILLPIFSFYQAEKLQKKPKWPPMFVDYMRMLCLAVFSRLTVGSYLIYEFAID